MSKIFNTRQITKSNLRSLLFRFARHSGVNVVIFNNRGKRVLGTYNALTRNMYINTSQTKRQMMCTFFHELGHHEAVRLKKWKRYHFNSSYCMDYNTVFEIENGIDKIGEKLWNKYVETKQWGRYKYAYPKSKKKLFVKTFTSNP